MHKDWTALAKHFEDSAQLMEAHSVALNAMVRLCVYIGASPMRDGLFGHTSLNGLRISQIPANFPPHPSIAWLVIRPVAEGQIEFEFHDTNVKERRWRRIVDAGRATERFKKFIIQIGWSNAEMP